MKGCARGVIKLIVVLCWVACIAAFLFIPRVMRRFSTEKSLSIFVWPTTVDAAYVKRFEEETGIKLYFSYYENNHELYNKLMATGGAGYDLIMPSDYSIDLLKQHGLLKPIDTSRLFFFEAIDKRITHLYFDPTNSYSVPYFWGMFGLCVNKEAFGGKLPAATWGLIFDPAQIVGPIGMTEGPREAIMIAAQYLFGRSTNLDDPEKITQIRTLLFSQKKSVYAYTEARSTELITSGSCPVVLSLSSDALRIARDYPSICFVVPDEGGFCFIDSWAIPKGTNKDDMIYQFLNFLYRPEVLAHHTQRYGFCSPLSERAGNVPRPSTVEGACPTEEQFKKLEFFQNTLPASLLNDMWMQLMAQ